MIKTDVLFPTFPCVINGREFKTKEEYVAECERIKREYPKFHEGLMKCLKEESEYIDDNHRMDMMRYVLMNRKEKKE